jgi:arylsulfatase A-like enzyme
MARAHRVRRISLALAAASGAIVAAIACSGPPATTSVEVHADPPPTTIAEPEAPPPPSGAARIRYDLAAHLARAELRDGDTLVVDFGTPGAAKYTIGGWRTRVGDDVRDGDVSASPMTSATGFVLAPADRDGPLGVELHARAPADGRTTIYVGGRTLGHATLPSDSYASARVVLPAESVHRGENMVQLRVPRVGAVGAVSAGVLIDWMRVGPEEDPHAGVAPPSPSELAQGTGTTRALVIPEGWSLGYAMEVPSGARLRGRLRGTGSLEVIAVRDGAPDTAIGTVAASSDGAEVDLSLASVEGSIVRLDLHARGGVVRFSTPAIVTLDGTPTRPRPHVRNAIVYLTDTLRADKLRPYRADTRVHTPRLDAWAHGATVLTRGHGQENWTKPSVATLLSGLYPWEHHATGEDSIVPDAVDLISERLGREGFYTGAFVANGFCSDRFGFRQGWRTFRNYVREGLRNQAEFVAHDVLDWLDHRPTDQPFFLYVHTVDPHVPYMPPAAQLALYDPLPYDGVVDFGRDRELLEHVKAGALALNERDREHLRALYDGEISYHDTHFGGIIDGLESRGLADDTMIVFTADHGEEFWDHGSVGHGHSVFEELIHVPLIVRIPGVTDGSESGHVDDVVGLVDVIPTMYETLGRPVPSDLSGRSFLPQLLGESGDAPRASVTGFMEGWRAINVGRIKLVQRTERTVLLYDTTDDPGETHDLASERPIAVRYARGLLGLYLAGVEHGGTNHGIAAQATTIDAHTREELEALGYAGASRPAQDDGTE